MTPADYDAFCAVVVGFAEIKGKHLSAAAIEIYWRSMQHCSTSTSSSMTLPGTSALVRSGFFFR